MGAWTEQVVPRVLHAVMGNEPLEEIRRQTLAGLSGRVLEIGFGTGLNLSALPDTVDHLDVIEPSDTAWAISGEARQHSPVRVTRLPMPDDGGVPAPDGHYDGVVIAFTLCTVPDPDRTLAEVARVLRPGAELRFLEHGLDPRPAVARVQRVLDPVQRTLVGGCRLVRRPEQVVADAGYTVTEVSAGRVPMSTMMPTVNHLTRGTAVP